MYTFYINYIIPKLPNHDEQLSDTKPVFQGWDAKNDDIPKENHLSAVINCLH